MNIELTVEQKVVAKEAFQSFWQECQNMVTYWDNLIRLNKRLGMPESHATMLSEKQHRDEWHKKMTETYNLLRRLEQ